MSYHGLQECYELKQVQLDVGVPFNGHFALFEVLRPHVKLCQHPPIFEYLIHGRL